MGKKQNLRQELLEQRAAMDPADVAVRSTAVAERVFQFGPFQDAGTVMVYADFRNEVQTGAIIAAALDAGKRVGLPLADREQKMLTVIRITNYPEDLEAGAYGIPEPKSGLTPLEVKEIDLILVPGVGYDTDGYRLGFGGGYYDRFLRGIRRRTVKAGLAYDFQVKDTVHPDSHDRGVHYIITESRTLKVPRHRIVMPVLFRSGKRLSLRR
ncbi:MAG: 5-formyltetrahydrofolate cyclo-ligase [Desulforudis sp.]|jgi:5-formyltetrahydrofolate cyclo-ligase|nr:MAG: 5-formyltetrahydrofolate cyclo-ligase [Desulforudis sp.]